MNNLLLIGLGGFMGHWCKRIYPELVPKPYISLWNPYRKSDWLSADWNIHTIG